MNRSSLFLLFFLILKCMCEELQISSIEMIACNVTKDCEPYLNSCQLTDCQDGMCYFVLDIFAEGCCNEPSDCDPKDCTKSMCIENTCAYTDSSDDCEPGVLDYLGAIFGFCILGLLVITFLVVTMVTLFRTFLKKFRFNTPSNKVDVLLEEQKNEV